MPLPRPLNFLLLCLGLLVLQQALSAAVAREVWHDLSPMMRMFFAAALLAGIVHALVLLAQLPGALRWRPRGIKRPSVEMLLERRRIGRELHDRVGAQLVNALALNDASDARQSEQRAILEHGLLELRFIVDNMDDANHTLADHFSQLRSRVQPALHRQGIALDWEDSSDHLPGAPHSPLLVLIAQEALSNVIQHSQATRVSVSVTRATNPLSWRMEIADNGKGMPRANGHAIGGAGLKGIYQRVLEAGGQVELLRPPEGGTCLRVTLPDMQ